jgi:hypothetical protein
MLNAVSRAVHAALPGHWLRNSSLVLAGLLVCASAAAVEVKYTLDPAQYGHLDQHDTDCKGVGCGPTAAANSFQFLQTRYASIYAGPRTLIGAPNPNTTLVQVANTLGGYMGCSATCGTGTLIEDFILGKLKYFDTYAAGTTEVHGQMNFAWRSATAKPAGIADSTKPTLAWLANEIKNGQDVELFVGSGDDKIQHYITLTGISFDDATNQGTMWIVDPWDGKEHNFAIDGLSADGYIDTAYTIDGAAADFVYHAVAESPLPVPEPGSWLLMLAGGLLLLRRSDWRH